MSKLITICAILSIVVCATAKEVTLQITDVEALTLTIPDDWEALISQVIDEDPEGPSELISVGPPVNIGPFFVGDDILEEQPHLTLCPQYKLYELSQLRASFRFTKLPLKYEDGGQLIIIEEIRDSSEAITGYYQINQKNDQTRFSADINTKSRTWTATAIYPAAMNQFSKQFIAVINSINIRNDSDPSEPPQVISVHNNLSPGDHALPAINKTQPKEENLSKIICPRCKGEQGVMDECPLCAGIGRIWVERPSD